MSAALGDQAAPFIQVAPWWRLLAPTLVATHRAAGWAEGTDRGPRPAVFDFVALTGATRVPVGAPVEDWEERGADVRTGAIDYVRMSFAALARLTGMAWCAAADPTGVRVQYRVARRPGGEPHVIASREAQQSFDLRRAFRGAAEPELLRAALNLPQQEWRALGDVLAALGPESQTGVVDAARALTAAAQARREGRA